MSLLDSIFEIAPPLIKDVFVTGFNWVQFRKRYQSAYTEWKAFFKEKEFAALEELEEIQEERLNDFLAYVATNSPYYKDLLLQIGEEKITINDLQRLPILGKETLRQNLKNAYTLERNKAYISKTGGTTGKSLEVLFRWDDFQERMAMLDYFRERYGFSWNHKIAWFSGKALLGNQDLKRKQYWRTDYLNNIRYYSTFHITEETALSYIDDFNKFKPEFLVGFPSSLVELVKAGMKNNKTIEYNIKAIFPTAETLIDEEVSLMEKYFSCPVYNQYASSEGAPFITECEKRNLHIELLSGVIEVVDDNNKPTQEGRMLVTSFSTKGTPLIRYDIGDRLKLKEGRCTCGRATPLVERIEGRISDFVYSKERGKIYLGNISNCVKYVKGVVRFQLQQLEVSSINVLIVKDPNVFGAKDESLFLKELRDRLGDSIGINFHYVDNIPLEKSGKYRIVKNLMKNTAL